MTPFLRQRYHENMRRAFTRVMILVVLAACFVCPVMQMFDHWDHELKTGHDTESTLVILALCVGATIAVAQGVVSVSEAVVVRIIKAIRNPFRNVLEACAGIGATPFLAASPPLAILRI